VPQLMLAGRPRYRSISGMAGDFSSSPKYPDGVWGPLSLPFSGYQGAISLGVKQAGHESDHACTSSAEVKNVCS
jgi:hypothetical protein